MQPSEVHAFPNGTPPPIAAPQPGFPLGEPILYVRHIADTLDRNIACSVENVYSQQMALLRPTKPMGWTDRGVSEQFVLCNPSGVPLLYLSKHGINPQSVQINGPTGEDLGLLGQTAPFGGPAGSLPMTLLYEQRPVGSTWIGRRGGERDTLRAPIYGAHGEPIATVDRQWRYRGGGWRGDDRYYDYKLDCPAPQATGISTLLLAVALCHYVFDRLSLGGPAYALARASHR